jgi:hypothetical protein
VGLPRRVGVIAITMCLLMLWLSFTANMCENAWRLGVERAVRLNHVHSVFVCILEALSFSWEEPGTTSLVGECSDGDATEKKTCSCSQWGRRR